MAVASVAVSLLLVALLAFAAARKLSHRERIVQSYRRVGVPEDKLDLLAGILLAGAAGVLLGLLWVPVGVAATIGVLCYFAIAIVAHLRANDARNLPAPLAIAMIAAVALALRLGTA
jgi:DoxX-like family